MYLAGYTMQEIADKNRLRLGGDLSNFIKSFEDFTILEKSQKILANFQDSDFETPIYNICYLLKRA